MKAAKYVSLLLLIFFSLILGWFIGINSSHNSATISNQNFGGGGGFDYVVSEAAQDDSAIRMLDSDKLADARQMLLLKEDAHILEMQKLITEASAYSAKRASNVLSMIEVRRLQSPAAYNGPLAVVDTNTSALVSNILKQYAK